jgi:Na+/melibiose symporter-like transporter
MQFEISGICFGISSFLRKSGIGLGIGIAALMYFLNILANISEDAEVLKYITPFGYTEGSDIINNGELRLEYIIPGMIFMVIGITLAYVKYTKKDILVQNLMNTLNNYEKINHTPVIIVLTKTHSIDHVNKMKSYLHDKDYEDIITIMAKREKLVN